MSTDIISHKDLVKGTLHPQFEEILTEDALTFLVELHKKFNKKRLSLLEDRQKRQVQLDEGKLPNFLAETSNVRESEWKVAPVPADLQDRRVEITGPVDRKMVINALNSGAKVFMADFEDSNTPNWFNGIQGQLNMRDAINRTITYTNPKNNKFYELKEEVATLMVRPRGWHLEEKNIVWEGEKMSGSLVDFGLYFFHNVKTLLENGSGPYFYLPKLESHQEARLWNEVFVFAQEYLDIPKGTIKVTVLIETILASFELHEILFELKDHIVGLNCGRWDYIFSYIKKFKNHSDFVLPDRAKVTMKTPFMEAYSKLVIKTCHKRGAHAIGGMSAFIPIKNDDDANKKAMDKVRQDKLTEVQNGHDGTWVAHPGMVSLAFEIFDEYMPNPNQVDKQLDDFIVIANDLIQTPKDTITEEGVRQNINVGILYMESWLRGNGAVALYNLMEDAATAEISRTQLWQWLKHQCNLEDGRPFTAELYENLKKEEIEKIKNLVGEERYQKGRFNEAIDLFDKLVLSEKCDEFLTLSAYELV